MKDDPIIAEVRRVREQIAAEFNHDVSAMFRDIRERRERGEFAGFQMVRHPPRPPQVQPERRTGT